MSRPQLAERVAALMHPWIALAEHALLLEDVARLATLVDELVGTGSEDA